MDTSKIVGEKIKALREDKSISIEELAQRSGLAIEQIERIENNIDIPSLAPLIKIARVLGVRLGTFLDDQDEVGPVVCRKKEAKDAISFSNNAIHSRKHMEYHSLSKSKADRHMEPFIIDVMPTQDTDFVLSSHEGEEFIMVMEGIMEISYGKNTYLTRLRFGMMTSSCGGFQTLPATSSRVFTPTSTLAPVNAEAPGWTATPPTAYCPTVRYARPSPSSSVTSRTPSATNRRF